MILLCRSPSQTLLQAIYEYHHISIKYMNKYRWEYRILHTVNKFMIAHLALFSYRSHTTFIFMGICAHAIASIARTIIIKPIQIHTQVCIIYALRLCLLHIDWINLLALVILFERIVFFKKKLPSRTIHTYVAKFVFARMAVPLEKTPQIVP